MAVFLASQKVKKGKKAYCKICKAGVVHAGGTTNLKNYLYMWHHLIHDELYQESVTAVEVTSPSTLDNLVKHVIYHSLLKKQTSLLMLYVR